MLKSEKQNKNKMKFAINLNIQCIMMISIKNIRNYKLVLSLEEAYSIFFRSDLKETHFLDFYNIDYSSYG